MSRRKDSHGESGPGNEAVIHLLSGLKHTTQETYISVMRRAVHALTLGEKTWKEIQWEHLSAAEVQTIRDRLLNGYRAHDGSVF